MHHRLLFAAAALAAALAVAGCAETLPTDDDCRAALENDIAVRLETARATSPGVADAHRDNLLAASGPYLQRCRSDWSRQRIECARSAETLDALAACDPEVK